MSIRRRLAAVAAPAALAACATVSASACAYHSDPVDRPVPSPMKDVGPSAYEAASKVQLPATKPIEMTGLHNVFELSPNIVSGSEPHGEEAFRELRKMGVKTILSVDGKVPDEALAAKYGMTYVHVPIQYKGITEKELTQISKTFREKDGPFYVHCFHGKHRGPAAAEVGRIVLDGIPREKAIAEMRQWCGTAKSYDGLYRTIATAPIPDAARTRAYAWDFPAAQPIRGFRHAMIEASRADDNLKSMSKGGWKADPEHPDADPVNDAAKLAEMLALSAKLEDVAAKPADFHRLMDASVAASRELEAAVRAWKSAGGPQAAVDAGYVRVAKSCTDCHAIYRDGE
jgi:protein tyrosine phosphatase (PTP) superfamily phosphohydrolase (DUF442 family)